MAPRIEPYGDAAILVVFGEDFAERHWHQAHRLAGVIRAAMPEAVTDVIPTYASVLVELDPLRTDVHTVSALVRRALAHGEGEVAATGHESGVARLFVVPVVYGGRYGPDLEEVARHEGLTPDELVQAHTGATYRIRCLGTPVGEPLLDGPPLPRPVPRRSSPRTKVPAGSVALAGRQATIYTWESPGGWALIGRTPLRFARPEDPPVPYRPGDVIRFRAIPPDAFADWEGVSVEAVEVTDR